MHMDALIYVHRHIYGINVLTIKLMCDGNMCVFLFSFHIRIDQNHKNPFIILMLIFVVVKFP